MAGEDHHSGTHAGSSDIRGGRRVRPQAPSMGREARPAVYDPATEPACAAQRQKRWPRSTRLRHPLNIQGHSQRGSTSRLPRNQGHRVCTSNQGGRVVTAPETWADLAHAWGHQETRGTNRLPLASERDAAAFITENIRAAKAEAWQEGREEPDDCCGSCPRNSCPWDNGGTGPINPYLTPTPNGEEHGNV